MSNEMSDKNREFIAVASRDNLGYIGVGSNHGESIRMLLDSKLFVPSNLQQQVDRDSERLYMLASGELVDLEVACWIMNANGRQPFYNSLGFCANCADTIDIERATGYARANNLRVTKKLKASASINIQPREQLEK